MKKDTQSPLSCAYCGKPILPSEVYYRVQTPTGPKPVHHKCMEVRAS